MNADLTTEITETFDNLSKVFSLFNQDQIDKIPFEGSWTPGQVAEHIAKSVSNLQQFLGEPTEPTLGPYDEKVKLLRKIFLDFNTRMKSPDFILPSDSKHEQKMLLATFAKLKTDMIKAAETMDLTLTCKNFPLPVIGFLTRIEWLTFFIVHTKRHTHQLANMLNVFNK